MGPNGLGCGGLLMFTQKLSYATPRPWTLGSSAIEDEVENEAAGARYGGARGFLVRGGYSAPTRRLYSLSDR